MATKAQVATYWVNRIFQNVLKLITGAKMQEAGLYIIEHTVNQSAYDTKTLEIDNAIDLIESDVLTAEDNISTLQGNIITINGTLATIQEDVLALEDGAILKGQALNVSIITDVLISNNAYLFGFVIKVNSFTPGATIRIAKVVSNEEGVNVADDLFEEFIELIEIEESALQFNQELLVYPTVGNEPAINPRIQIYPVGCNIDLKFLYINNYI